MGLGKSEEDKDFFVYSDGSGGNAFVDSEMKLDENIGHRGRSHTTSIDRFAASFSRLDFLKMDTEGYEANILRGAENTIKKFKPVITMSAYHKPQDKVELAEIVQSFYSGYHCDLVKSFDEDLLICTP